MKKLILVFLSLVLMLGMVIAVSSSPANAMTQKGLEGFLKIVSPVDYEVVNPNKDLMITVQTDSCLGYIEWYFDYIHNSSYTQIPFVPNKSGYFSFVIPSEVLQTHRGLHFLHIHKVVASRHSFASYGDSLVLQIGGLERMHVTGFQILPAQYQRGYARVEADQVVVYERAEMGEPKGRILGRYLLSEWKFEQGWKKLDNLYIPVLKGEAGNDWYWDEQWTPYGTGWTLRYNVKRIIEPARIIVFGWTKSQASRYDYFGFGHSYRIDIRIKVKDQIFEIPAAVVGTVWENDNLNVEREIEKVVVRYRSSYFNDFGVEPEEIEVKFHWTGSGNWRALFATAPLRWIKEKGTVVEVPLDPDENGNFVVYHGGIDKIPFPRDSWRWDPKGEYQLSIRY